MEYYTHFSFSARKLLLSGKLLVLLFFFSNQVFGQDKLVNAYTLSHDMYLLKRKLTGTNADTVFKAEAEKALQKLYYYSNTDKSSELYKVIGHDSMLLDLVYKIQRAATYIPNNEKLNQITKELITKPGFVKYQKDLKEFSGLKTNLDILLQAMHVYNDTAVSFDSRVSIELKSLDTISKQDQNGTTYYDKTQFDHLNHITDSLLKDVESKLILVYDSINAKKDVVIGDIHYTVEYQDKEFEKALSDIQQNNYEINLTDDKESGSIAGYKLPSEAEMIDAVATYIASRVKQETVLWFFEEMRLNTERYELLNTAFPETIKLLKTDEIFEAPNMGSAWKYALSEDFIKLPEHVLNSDWLRARIPGDRKDELELLGVAADIAHMVNNRLSYDDIIKQLYMKNCIGFNTSKEQIITNSISFLYAINTEMSVLTKEETLRKVTFEELQALSIDQMQILLQLLNAKYQKCIENQYAAISHKHLTPAQKQEISVWFGKSLIALEQFDKILKQVREGIRNSGDQQVTLFDGYNIWKLISDAMISAFPNPESQKIKYSLDRMDDAFEVYHLMAEKNYSGAVVKTLQLVDSLLYKPVLGIAIKNYNPNFDFRVPGTPSADKTVFHMNLMELDQYFIRRRVNPKKFSLLSEKIGRSTIDVDITDKTKFKLEQENKQWFLKFEPKYLKDVLVNANPKNRIKHKIRINHLIKDLNSSQLDKIVMNAGNWGGTLNLKKDSVFFSINSLAAQALISQDKKAMQMIKKLASFLNDVALADDAQELKEVVESYALPPGSYKLKRNAWQSWSLNAFAGPYAGYETSTILGIREKIENPDKTITRPISEFGWNYGISVPIGITYSKTIGKRTYANSRLSQNYRYNQDLIKIGRHNLYVRSNWNFSFTFSIVDIGAVVCYRMSNRDSVLNQSFKWEQFVSPGIHIGIALPRTPLVFQIGYQYTPRIRKLDAGGSATEELGMWRSYAGIFFDIPMFNFWVKTRSVYFE